MLVGLHLQHKGQLLEYTRSPVAIAKPSLYDHASHSIRTSPRHEERGKLLKAQAQQTYPHGTAAMLAS
jgi:hypothetical protein